MSASVWASDKNTLSNYAGAMNTQFLSRLANNLLNF